MALTDKLTDIGNAIREKNGTTDLIPLADMPQAIRDIQSGGGDNTDLTEIETIIDESGVLEDSEATVTEKVEQLIERAEFMDNFWDAYQKNGTRTDYNNGFAYDTFTNDTFYPKYNITPIKNGTVFRQSRNLTIDLKERLKECNVVLDTSKLDNFNYMFEACGVSAIPLLNCINGTNFTYVFNGCTNLHTIEKIIVNKDLELDRCFVNCSKLQNIIFEGEIGKNINIGYSPLLTMESIQSIIDGLATVETAQTLTLHTNVKAKLTEEQLATITSKNWNLA